MSFDAYIQRADQYITKKIHKFEQQKRGNRSPPRANGYSQMPSQSSHSSHSVHDYLQGPSSCHTPPLQLYGHAPPPPLPKGWAQEYDSQSQRWYYVERVTGRAEWILPTHTPPPHRAFTFQQPQSPLQHHEENRAKRRARAISQPQRPSSSSSGQFLDARRNEGRHGASTSPHQRLPPGAHLDMRTGQVVTDMFPEGQSQALWAREVGRI
ncbi:hypothetical protein EJ02DRAFT_211915 [Clathrospora elynae]|uniref:WW domain-containing protein n=1 Tax=Clathrospora elynae TaxID=706981 RepID=A0A6A5SMS1_9PLEO|nr:hypothetical protein EJ02DRAFT_211915 [Clathrospora elynae]